MCNIDYGSILDCFEFSNLPLSENDEYFEPLTEPAHIQEWNQWLEYTANTVGVTVEEINANNFKTLKQLLIWCSKGERYCFALKKYNEQCSKYYTEWANYIKNKYKEHCEHFSIDMIAQIMKKWTDEMFNDWFIWGLDTSSIIKATKYNNVSIFDSSPIEHFLSEYLQLEDIEDEE